MLCHPDSRTGSSSLSSPLPRQTNFTLHVLGRSFRFSPSSVDGLIHPSEQHFPSHPSFLLRPKLSSGEGDKTEEKLSRKREEKESANCEWKDEGGKRLAAIPVGSAPLLSSPPSALCADGGLITRAADLKLSVPLSQPTNRLWALQTILT